MANIRCDRLKGLCPLKPLLKGVPMQTELYFCVAREPNNYPRRIIEGIHILNKKDSCVNIICGLEIDKSWKSYFKGDLLVRPPSPVLGIPSGRYVF